MAVHVICPSLRCRKILTFADDVKGNVVTCRYCQMEFRVPVPRAKSPQRAKGNTTPTR